MPPFPAGESAPVLQFSTHIANFTPQLGSQRQMAQLSTAATAPDLGKAESTLDLTIRCTHAAGSTGATPRAAFWQTCGSLRDLHPLYTLPTFVGQVTLRRTEATGFRGLDRALGTCTPHRPTIGNVFSALIFLTTWLQQTDHICSAKAKGAFWTPT